MPKVNDKFVVEKQLSLPFKRALEISFKSLKIRFWRSMITAAGIFLGIAFLTTVLTQWLMQAPVPVRVGPGLVSLSGEINGPGDFEVWHEIPVSEGLAAGIPKEVIDEVKPVNGKFHLRDIVQGIIDVKHNEKRLAEAKAENGCPRKSE